MKEYMALGIDRFILSGYPHLEECYRFAELVFPKLPLKATTGNDLGRRALARSAKSSPTLSRHRNEKRRRADRKACKLMAKEIRFNAFEMNCVAHQSPGLWRHPRDRSCDYKRLSYWIELAKILERGLFDGLFIADVLGVYDVFGGDARRGPAARDAGSRQRSVAPRTRDGRRNRHLGFGVTATLSFEPPFNFARRMSTLDHLTDGRIGWNIVTGYLDSAARGCGEKQPAHDDRYDVAEDYMEVVYKLWEGGWADDAVAPTQSPACSPSRAGP